MIQHGMGMGHRGILDGSSFAPISLSMTKSSVSWAPGSAQDPPRGWWRPLSSSTLRSTGLLWTVGTLCLVVLLSSLQDFSLSSSSETEEMIFWTCRVLTLAQKSSSKSLVRCPGCSLSKPASSFISNNTRSKTNHFKSLRTKSMSNICL